MKFGLILKTLAASVILAFTASSAQAASFSLTGTVRDFQDTHPDFEIFAKGKPGGFDPGIVAVDLGADKKPVYAGLAGNPTTSGQANFDQWYRDVPGVNLSKDHSITLEDLDGDGIFTYASDSFFPINNELFGNQGRSQNYHFTYEINSQFTYNGGETFQFTGDDDVFLFINDKLVIDLGGVHQSLSQTVNLDDLGLTVGEKYDLDFFFAERQTVASNLRIDTSIILEQKAVPEPATISLLSLAVLGIGFTQSRRKQATKI
ncbi:MAG TPA: fibro-slime domain-containing protein [Nostocaceae cyanobacterium]|nr:fibro-slime domain-containing protein [Nostocaceae cyanobacterium]